MGNVYKGFCNSGKKCEKAIGAEQRGVRGASFPPDPRERCLVAARENGSERPLRDEGAGLAPPNSDSISRKGAGQEDMFASDDGLIFFEDSRARSYS
jgi:hypothetical protein